MKVYGFKKNDMGIMEIKNTLEAKQKFVGGLIEAVALTEELDLICNDEGKLNGLKPNVAWLEDGKLVEIICGDCFI